jgi:lipopolysaccharide transport system ATP-binding protein
MDDVAIKIRGLSKKYRIGGSSESYKTFRDAIMNTVRSPLDRLSGAGTQEKPGYFWALKDLSFDVNRGEVIGIIGRNGAGKSTLLKILSRITEPTEGRAEIHGRVGSLLEVGTGFHPELTGRENIFLSGAIIGMKRPEIAERFEDIIKFAEVEKFLDLPLKHYSSGMQLRLGFAVAAHLEPEILIVDEVLAVGDASFQKKCLGKMSEVSGAGRTVFFVSHNMGMISVLCNRAILLNAGRIIKDGQVQDVVQQYLMNVSQLQNIRLSDRKDRTGNGNIRATTARIGALKPVTAGKWIAGAECSIEIDYECREARAFDNVHVAVGICRIDESPLLYLGTYVKNQDFDRVSGKGTFVCTIPNLPLEPGHYYAIIEISSGGVIIDRIDRAAEIEVLFGDYYHSGIIWPYGSFLCDYDWQMRNQ